MSVQIITGDCREVLRSMADQSIHCAVTSPPYFGLRDYGVDGQMGLEATPAEFVAGIVDVFREVRRVLRDDGTLFLNLGDSYFGGGRGGGSEGSKQRTNVGALIGPPKWSSVNADARRAAPYGTSGTEPEGFPERDCLCESLCDGCRKAYRFGKSHSGSQRAPMPAASNFASSLEHTASSPDHPPMSGLVLPGDRIEGASHGLAPCSGREGGQHHGAPASMPIESSPQHQEGCRQLGQPSECQLCGCSLRDSVPLSARKAGCNCDIALRASGSDTSGTDASDSAYRHLTTAALKPKDLIGIPWRVAFALQADGWYLRQDIIWHKPNPMPESVTDRCTKSHEYLFLLSKSRQYYFDAEAIAEPVAEASIARLSQDVEGQDGSSLVPGKTNGTMKAVGRPQAKRAAELAREHGLTQAHIDAIRSVGIADAGKALVTTNGAGKNTDEIKRLAAEAKIALGGYYREFLMGGTRNKRSVWTVATMPFKEAHFATFPTELIEPCILAGCPKGGTVLDPFGGAGTTGLVADRLHRSAVLIELNPEYAAMARKRFERDAGMFAEVA